MIKGRIIYWVAGTLTSFGGVLVVKVLSRELEGSQKLTAMIIGFTLAILGLFILTLGTRRGK